MSPGRPPPSPLGRGPGTGPGTLIFIAMPPAPPNFLNLSETKPGHYLAGHNKFIGKDFHLFSVFRREFGPADEILLIILSVLLIDSLSELFYAVLLRQRGRNVPPSSTFIPFGFCLLQNSDFAFLSCPGRAAPIQRAIYVRT